MDEALDRVGLTGFKKRAAGRLSLGQEKRLAIAGAIMGSPELVILDEPLSGLDPMGVRGMIDMLRELATDGQTLVISSHRLHEMQEILTHAAVILDGRVVREAELEEFLGRPGTWRIEVRDLDKAKLALGRIGASLKEEPGSQNAVFIEAPGIGGDSIAAALVEEGAGLVHLSSARRGLQASFEAIVEEQRALAAASGAANDRGDAA